MLQTVTGRLRVNDTKKLRIEDRYDWENDREINSVIFLFLWNLIFLFLVGEFFLVLTE